MKNLLPFLALALAAGPVLAAGECAPRQDTVIDSEVRCVDQGGISIGLSEDEGAKVACMGSKEVQGRCGPDGRLTRLHAYTVWFNKLKAFEDKCANEGGTFAYKDPNFIEPGDESFCLQAEPEVGSSMFEEPLCNYRSVCPAVTVVCDKPCVEHSIAKLF